MGLAVVEVRLQLESFFWLPPLAHPRDSRAHVDLSDSPFDPNMELRLHLGPNPRVLDLVSFVDRLLHVSFFFGPISRCRKSLRR